MIRWLSVGALLTLSAPVFAATGGPDLYGYRWVDNGEQDGPSVDGGRTHGCKANRSSIR